MLINYQLNLETLSIIQNGKLNTNYNEQDVSDYMKNSDIEINVDISNGSKNFTLYNGFNKKIYRN